ncbi:MAG: TolB family protein [Acidimicrobiia bacterium]
MRRSGLAGTVMVGLVGVLAVMAGIPALGVQGETTRVSERPSGFGVNGESYSAAITDDGRYIAYYSEATNLVTADTNGMGDVFVHDTTTGATTLVSVNSNGTQTNDYSFNAAISDNGRYIAFESGASNLVTGDTNHLADVFVHDTTTGTTTRVSVDTNGIQADGGAFDPAISGDGRYIAFRSDATNLAAGDTNGVYDVFVHDTTTGVTSLVSVDTNGIQADAGSSGEPAISGDGRYITFESLATNLVTDDTNFASDVFVHDTTTGATTRVSVDTNGIQSNGNSYVPSISGDGRYITYYSSATNLATPGDTNGTFDVFVHDTTTGATTRVSVDTNGTQANGQSRYPAMSGDGRYIAFESFATNLVTDDTNGFYDVFVHDTTTGATTRISVTTNGTQADEASFDPAISGDGRFITYYSDATNLVASDTNGFYDVFVHQFLADAPDVDWFVDDDDSVFEGDINAIATADITRGCNPPVNDRYCPDAVVTRGQMAAFLNRALRLAPAGDQGLTDIAGSVFTADINALAQADITKGCNPPANDRYCPDAIVTRGQMAAFLNRALGLAPAGDQGLTDIEGSVFTADIDALAHAGITKGCNPPANDRFCPDDVVTRGQMAAFLNRALLP